jgi:hypothetical protein
MVDEVAIPAAFERMIAATNAEDTEAFLKCFAANGVVNDWGRRFAGAAAIASWNERENIGVHARIALGAATQEGPVIVVPVTVSGEGYNGGGSFAVEVRDGLITNLEIRG